MSSSSEEDIYGDAAGRLDGLKSEWKPDVGVAVSPTSDHNATSEDTDPDPADHRHHPRVKRKHTRGARSRNADRAPDLDTSATSDVSVHSGDARGRTPRGRSSRGRRSRPRNSAPAAPAVPVVNVGCFSDSEESYRPLFSKSSTQSKQDLDSSGIDRSLNERNSDAETENEEFSVKVHWRSKEYHKFQIRKHQKLTSVFDFFADLERVPVDNLLLTLGDRVLRPADTPATIDYNVCRFIEGGVVSRSVARVAERAVPEPDGPDAGDELTVRMRSREMKEPLRVTLGRNQRMSVAMIKFSERTDASPGALRFFFDGDPVDPDSTPADLELEGGECFDVRRAE